MIKCNECKEKIKDKENHYAYNKEVFCEGCFNELFTRCEECNKIFLKDDLENSYNGLICDECREKHYTYCDGCGEYFPNSDIKSGVSGYYCEECFNELFVYCAGCDNLIYKDDAYYDDIDCEYFCSYCYNDRDDVEEEHGITIEREHKFIESETFNKNPFKTFVGVEIETHTNDGTDIIEYRKDLHKYFSAVEDGSICGKEFVSMALNGDLLLNSIKELTQDLQKRDYTITSSEGLHIHLDLREYKENVNLLKKIITFYSKYEDLIFLMLPKSRNNGGFCRSLKSLELNKILRVRSVLGLQKKYYKFKSKKRIKNETEHKYGTNRYYGINLHSVFYRGSLEIRYHSGTINYEKIKNWILINLTILDLCKKFSLKSILGMKHSLDFFVSLFNRNLQDYITKRIEKFNPQMLVKVVN